MTHFITMVPSLWCSGTEPAMSPSDACTCFLSRKQVIVCSERFKDIKTSPSAAKSNNAAERAVSQPLGWGSGWGVMDADEGIIISVVTLKSSHCKCLSCNY